MISKAMPHYQNMTEPAMLLFAVPLETCSIPKGRILVLERTHPGGRL